jgi:tRNA G10  N-methylase Trm11
VHNPFEFQKRDVKRPQQRSMYSIPPRLAKIMINLSGNKGVLLDPFCGIGGILQEAALMGLDFYGTDIDEECIPHARQNLKWISREYGLKLGNLEERIQKGDATRLSRLFQPESIDLIVTEPNLGPALKIPPDQNRAERILRGLKPLYEKSFREFSIILKRGGRVCIVLPRFEFGKHFAHAEARKLAERSGFRPVNILSKHNLHGSFPYIDKERRHRTIREIWVFEKA